VDSGCINFAPLQTVGANVTGYTDSGLAAQTLYRYRVRAYSTAGNSPVLEHCGSDHSCTASAASGSAQ
jgi:hypothetical protein